MVPSAGNRRALLERGDADISYDLPNKDFVELKSNNKLSIVSVPYSNGLQYLGMNVTKPPFDNPKVRQAVAYAIPYQKIIDAVLYGLANPMFGKPAGAPTEVKWPQPTSLNTDMAKAKQLMQEAGYANGFEVPLSFDLGFAVVNEPLCILLQESLAEIGIRTTINKIPGSNWRTELNKKEMPLYVNVFSGWLDYPEYFFFWCYHGSNSVFNTMSYKNPKMDAADRWRTQCRRDRRHRNLRQGREGLCRSCLHRHPAHSAVPALFQRRDAEERVRLRILVSPPAGLQGACESLSGATGGRSRHAFDHPEAACNGDPESYRCHRRELPADPRPAR